jgi:hypothetical protein
MYVLNDDQLLPIWIVIQALNKIRELSDVMERGEVLTEAQAHLIAFVLRLKPLSKDHASSSPLNGSCQ